MIVDVIAVLIISLGFYFGYQRGFIKTVFDTLSFFFAILAALKLSPILINVLKSSLNLAPSLAYVLGIVATFLLIMILVRFIGKRVEDLFKAVQLNFINKFNGGALQALFFAIVVSYGIALMDKIHVIKEETKTASFSYPYLTKLPAVTQKMIEGAKPWFQEFWDATIEAMDTVRDKVDEN